MTCENFMLMAQSLLDGDESFSIKSVDGIAVAYTVDVPGGLYWPDTDELDMIINEAIYDELVDNGHSGMEPFSISEGRIVAQAPSGRSLQLDFSNAPKLKTLFRLDNGIAITDTAQTMSRTIEGVVWGSEPLASYVESEAHKRGLFYTDAGEVSVLYRYALPEIEFSVRVEGRPQTSSNTVALYHDLRDWYVIASKGRVCRIYPSQTYTVAYDKKNPARMSGYRTVQALNAVYVPSAVSQSRLHNTLSFTARPAEI